MADECCKLVGNLQLGGIFTNKCVTSVSMNAKAEIIKECGGEVLYGPTIGSVSVSGYATNVIHVGCPGKSGVSIPWVRRYDCDSSPSVVYFIPSGHGASFVAGDVGNLATLEVPLGRSYNSLNASSQSGPVSIYMETAQEDGYGLSYSGDPLPFNTDDYLVFSNFGVGAGDMYLQNFSLEVNPGEIPMATYSFMFYISE